MSISTIVQTARHCYFNYHQHDLSSSFTRRLQFSLRMTISFLVSGFLAYGTLLNNQIALQYLIPTMSILSIQETIGMTLSASYQMLQAIVPLSIFLFVVQKIGLGYKDYLAAELILLISSFFVAYKCKQVQTRKIALLFNAVFFSTIVNQTNLPSTFSFILLQEFVIGMAVALLISLLIFPLFATLDVENRVNYCLENLQQMQTLIVEAFLCQDQMGAQLLLARSSTIEQMVRTAMNLITTRLMEARFEPSRCLQRIFNRRRRNRIDLTIREQEDFISSLMFHVCSLQLMVKQCQFNNYHSHFTRELQPSLLHFSSCQSTVISSLLSCIEISKDEFNDYRSKMQLAVDSLRKAYVEARVRRVEYVLESATTIRSEDHLSHTFFLFQLSAIMRLLIQATTTDLAQRDELKNKKKKTRRTLRQWLKPQWPRLLSAFKSMVIIGVGSVFVMVPRLANAFENGQWILIALCMTQGDTVGGALITMKMRLIGTLLGAMWAYVTYVSVYDNVYHTFGMLVPWILFFGYLKLLPNWGYGATVAAFTPVLITLGRIPYGDSLPAGNYALLRIEENLVGIAIAMVLTIVIFPVFAIDVLKNNIQTTIQACRQGIDSMHSIYDQLLDHKHSDAVVVDVEEVEVEEIKSFADAQRSRFHQLVSSQRLLVEHASLEPTMWWFKNSFSSIRYNTLVDQQIDIFRMLHNIDAILMRIKECSNNGENQIKNLQTDIGGSLFLPDLHTELADISKQLSDCLDLWSSYFALTQTRFYQLFRNFTYSHTKLVESDRSKHKQHLIELYQTLDRLQNQHQESVYRIVEHYIDRAAHGELPAKFVPYAANENADLIIVLIAAMYYSTTQLVRDALALGTNIHTIFELETTTLYRSF